MPIQYMLVTESSGPLQSDAGPLAPGEIQYFLAEWSDSATSTLQNKFKEIALQIDEGFAQENPQLLLTELQYRVSHNVQRSCFQPMHLAKHTKEKSDHQNL